MNQPTAISLAKLLAPGLSCATAGAILCLGYYIPPLIKSTSDKLSTKEALHQLRSVFSSGSHVFPPAAFASAGLYAFLAWQLPSRRTGLVAAAAGCFGIAPFTTLVMVPLANQRLIDLDKKARAQGERVEGNKKEVGELLDWFVGLNTVRAGIMAVGAGVGLYTLLLV